MSRKRIASLLSAVMLVTSLTACNSAAMQAIQQLQSEASSASSESSSSSSAQISSVIPMPTIPSASSQSSAAAPSAPLSSSSVTPPSVEMPAPEILDIKIGGDGDREYRDGEYVMEATWEYVELDGVASADYPDLAYSLYDLNMVASNSGYDYANELRSLLDEFPEDAHPILIYDETVQIMRADTGIISLLYNCYYSSGGASPTIVDWTANLNTIGEYLELSAILNEPGKFPDLLIASIEEAHPEAQLSDDTRNYISESFVDGSINWTLDYQSMRVYFQEGEIMAGAVGPVCIIFWFDEHPDLIDAAYTTAPSSYGRQLPVYDPFYYDLDPDDGEKDILSLWTYPGEYMSVGAVELGINGKIHTLLTTEVDEICAYLLRVDDNGKPRNYLYLTAYGENAYPHLLVFDLDAEKPMLTRELRGTGLEGDLSVEDEAFGYFDYALNNPEHMTLSTRIEVLGTMYGTRTYRVDPATGVPVTDQQFFDVAVQPALTTLVPVDVYDIYAGKEATLPEGTVVVIVASDGESEVQVVTEDGGYYSIICDNSDWPCTVNGIPDYDVFDGLMYAG